MIFNYNKFLNEIANTEPLSGQPIPPKPVQSEETPVQTPVQQPATKPVPIQEPNKNPVSPVQTEKPEDKKVQTPEVNTEPEAEAPPAKPAVPAPVQPTTKLSKTPEQVKIDIKTNIDKITAKELGKPAQAPVQPVPAPVQNK